MSSVGEEAKDWIVSIATAVVLALIIRTFIVELYLVDGPSMRPTLQSAERLVVNKFIYRFREPQRGEILVFQYPRDTRRDFIKRVIAVPGDTIEIKSQTTGTDGKVWYEITFNATTTGWIRSDLVEITDGTTPTTSGAADTTTTTTTTTTTPPTANAEGITPVEPVSGYETPPVQTITSSALTGKVFAAV